MMSTTVFVQNILIWIAILHFRPRASSGNAASRGLWRYAMLFGSSTTIRAFRNPVEELTGINHLAWLLVYLVGVLAFVCLYDGIATLRSSGKSAYISYVGFSLLMLLIFTQIVDEPKNAHIAPPSNIETYLFRMVVHVYITAILLACFRAIIQYTRDASFASLKVRWIAIAMCNLSAIALFTLRMFSFTAWMFVYEGEFWIWLRENEPFLDWFESSVRVIWLIVFIPTHVYEVVLSILRFPKHYKEYSQLRETHQHLIKILVNSPVRPRYYQVTSNKTVWQLRHMDTVIYQHVIAIADAMTLLVKQPDTAYLLNHVNMNGASVQELKTSFLESHSFIMSIPISET